MRLKILLTTVLFVSISTLTFSQARKAKREIEQKGIIYHSEWSVGGRLYTNGWGIFGEKGKILSIYKTRVLQFEFTEVRDYKQKKQSPQSSNSTSPKDYYYGKLNNFFTIRAGAGFRRMIAEKAERKGVHVSMIYLGGITLGLLKPYYLNLHYTNDGNFKNVNQKYSESNKQYFLGGVDTINGASGFRYGLKEIDPVPGGYGKFGLNFDWASKDQWVKALEVGVMADIYYKKLPLMANQKQRFYLIAAYLSFQFGKRKY